ncbi:hypothetical protein NQ317_006924 [Molorchus minor]|uniref:Endonuclease/exonuclease/phosphatase domain-containing protein n=1 Tax=Molorchus minor TaxID=1323400 RepID=A0ABQ9IT07_9CUCU|nr:hypothetical protein NQ317_006924 [Molorchus minor]
MERNAKTTAEKTADPPAEKTATAEKSTAAENSAEFSKTTTKAQRRKTAKRTKLDNPTSSSESDSEMEVEATGPSSQPAQAPPAPPPKERIPPVILQSKDHWTWLSRALREKKIQYTSAKLVTDGIRIFPATTTDYRQITKILAEAKVGFHTYSLPEERQLRIVIRGLPEDLPEKEIMEDLQDQGYQPTTVQRMRNRRTKNKMPLVLVQLPEAQCASRSREPARTSGSATAASVSGMHKGSARPPEMCEVRRQPPFNGMPEAPYHPREVCQLRGSPPGQLQGMPQVSQETSPEAPSSQAHYAATQTSPKDPHPRPTSTTSSSPTNISYAQAARGRQQTKPNQPKTAPPPAHHQPNGPDGRDDGQDAGDVRDDGSTVREAPVDSINILSWNVNGIRPRRNELLEIADRLEPDIIAIQETKIDSRHEFRMRGYKVYRQDRNYRGGGVAVLVKSNITHHQTRAGGLGNLEERAIARTVLLPAPQIPLLGEDLGDLFPDAQQVIVIGDFNAKSQQWNSRRLNARGRELEGIPGRPSRNPTHRPARTDPAICQQHLGRAGHRIGSIANHREGSSDHDPILLTVWGTHTDNTIHTRKITDWGAFRAHLQTHLHDITLIHNTEELDLAVLNLETDIKTSLVHTHTTQGCPGDSKLNQHFEQFSNKSWKSKPPLPQENLLKTKEWGKPWKMLDSCFVVTSDRRTICLLVCRLIDVHEKLPNNISINSHKKHGRWNEKMAETGQEEGKQNIRIEGALFDPLDVHWIYLCCLGNGALFEYITKKALHRMSVLKPDVIPTFASKLNPTDSPKRIAKMAFERGYPRTY